MAPFKDVLSAWAFVLTNERHHESFIKKEEFKHKMSSDYVLTVLIHLGLETSLAFICMLKSTLKITNLLCYWKN